MRVSFSILFIKFLTVTKNAGLYNSINFIILYTKHPIVLSLTLCQYETPQALLLIFLVGSNIDL